MDIKIYNQNLQVGLNDYQELHYNILKCVNLIDIKKCISGFNSENDIDKNTYFAGITINDSHIYIIKNLKNNKKYVGETSNIIARMYAYTVLNKINDELNADIILHGFKNFQIEFIELNDKNIKYRKQKEVEYINKYKDFCYNVIHTDKIQKRNKNSGYIFGGIKFNSKQEIKNYIRENLDACRANQQIDLNSILAEFAKDLIKLHPNYDNFLT